MAYFVTHRHFYKHTYNKPYVVRVLFTVKVPAFCSLVADNMCRCDHWFARDGNVKIKYDIIDDKNLNRPQEEIIEKSIIIDLNTPYSASSRIELIVSNGSNKSDVFYELIEEIPPDPIKSNLI